LFLSDQKIASGQVKKYPGQRRVGLLFTAGQKYAWVGLGWVGLGQGPSLGQSQSSLAIFHPNLQKYGMLSLKYKDLHLHW